MKKLALIMLILVLTLTSCTKQSVEGNSQSRRLEIENLIEAKQQFVKAANLEDYAKILDPEDKELQTEQANWIADIKKNPIVDYSVALISLEQVNGNIYRAKLRQQYTRNGKTFKLSYYNGYKVVNGRVYDAGDYFEELKKGNITIKYTQENKKLAEEVIDDLNKLYAENIKRWGITPQRPLVIKIFDDIEALRQSIKLSMWQCAGWYEYGESVKLLVDNSAASRDRIETVVNHEMTHMFTLEKSSGNLAYWFAEGLATYYEVPENQGSPASLYKKMNVDLLTIDELEAMELEKLEDRQEISNYYNNAHLITAFLVENYGEDKINEILDYLGKYPSRKGPASENDDYYREYLHKTIPQILKINNYEVFKQQWQKQINIL